MIGIAPTNLASLHTAARDAFLSLPLLQLVDCSNSAAVDMLHSTWAFSFPNFWPYTMSCLDTPPTLLARLVNWQEARSEIGANVD